MKIIANVFLLIKLCEFKKKNSNSLVSGQVSVKARDSTKMFIKYLSVSLSHTLEYKPNKIIAMPSFIATAIAVSEFVVQWNCMSF